MTETTGAQDPVALRGESTLREIVLYLWQGRFLIACSMVIFVLLAYIWLFITPNQYEASAQFAPTESSSSSTPSLSSQVLGAVKAVGLGGGSAATVTTFQEFQALLTSQALADAMVKNHPVLTQAFAAQWDAQNKRWVEPTTPFYLMMKVVKFLVAMPGWQPPTAQTLSSYITANVVISADETTGIVTVTFDHPNRQFAKNLLVWMHRDADDILRQAARLQSHQRIEYLRKTLPTVTVTDQQTALIQLLDQQEQTSMMVEADPDYAAYSLDPPSVGDIPIWPKGILIVPAGLVVGMVFGICLHLLLMQFGIIVEGTEVRRSVRRRVDRLRGRLGTAD